MSDLDKLFENAPTGTDSIKRNGDIMRFFKDTSWWNELREEWIESQTYSEWKTIATRPQTEQPRKTVEDAVVTAKSEPEWTHTVNGSECVLLDPDKDCDGYYITKTHYGAFELAKEHELKPIKPTITKAEAWDKLGEDFAPSAMYMSINCTYEIAE